MTEISDWDVDENDWGDVNIDVETLDPVEDTFTKPSYSSPQDFCEPRVTDEDHSHFERDSSVPYTDNEISSLRTLLQTKMECLDILREELRLKDEENSRLHEQVKIVNEGEEKVKRVVRENEDLLGRIRELEEHICEMNSSCKEKVSATVECKISSDKHSYSRDSVQELVHQLDCVKSACRKPSSDFFMEDKDFTVDRFLGLCDAFVQHCSQLVSNEASAEESSFWLGMVHRFSEEVKTKISTTLSSPTKQMVEDEEEDKLDVLHISNINESEVCDILCAVTEVVREDSSSLDAQLWNDFHEKMKEKLANVSQMVKDSVKGLLESVQTKLQNHHKDITLLQHLIEEKKDAMDSMVSLQTECAEVAQKLNTMEQERHHLIESLKELEQEKMMLLKTLENETRHSHRLDRENVIQEVLEAQNCPMDDETNPPSVEAEMTDGTLLDVDSFPSMTSHMEHVENLRSHAHLPMSFAHPLEIPNYSIEQIFPKEMYEKESQLKDAMIDRLNTLIMELRGTEARLREGLECDYADLINENEKLRSHTQQLENDLSKERKIVVQLSNRMQEGNVMQIGVQTEEIVFVSHSVCEDKGGQIEVSPMDNDLLVNTVVTIPSKNQESASSKKRQKRKKGKAFTDSQNFVATDSKFRENSTQTQSSEMESEEMNSKYLLLVEENTKQKEEWHSLLSQLETVRQELTLVTEQSNTILKERDDLSEELNKLHDTLNEYETLVSSLQEQTITSQTVLAKTREEMDQLQVALQNESLVAQSSKQECQELSVKNESLQNRLIELEDKLRSVYETHSAELEQVKIQYCSLVEERHREADHSTSMNDTLTSVLEIMSSCLDVAPDSKKTEQLIELKKLAISCKSQLEFYKKELEEEYTASDTLRNEFEALGEQKENLMKQIVSLKEEVHLKDDQIEEFHKMLVSKKEMEMEHLASEVLRNEMEKQRVTFISEVECLKEELDLKNSQLERLQTLLVSKKTVEASSELPDSFLLQSQNVWETIDPMALQSLPLENVFHIIENPFECAKKTIDSLAVGASDVDSAKNDWDIDELDFAREEDSFEKNNSETIEGQVNKEPLVQHDQGWDVEDFDFKNELPIEQETLKETLTCPKVSDTDSTILVHEDSNEWEKRPIQKEDVETQTLEGLLEVDILKSEARQLVELIREKEVHISMLEDHLKCSQSREADLLKDIDQQKTILSEHGSLIEELRRLSTVQDEEIQRNGERVNELMQELLNREREMECVQKQFRGYESSEMEVISSKIGVDTQAELSVQHSSTCISTQTESHTNLHVSDEEAQERKHTQERIAKLMKRVKILQHQLQSTQQELEDSKQKLEETLQKMITSCRSNVDMFPLSHSPDVDIVSNVIEFMHSISVLYVESVQSSVKTDIKEVDRLQCLTHLSDVLKYDNSKSISSLLAHLQMACHSLENAWEDSLSPLTAVLCELSSWLSHYQENIEKKLSTLNNDNISLSRQLDDATQTLALSRGEEQFLKSKLSEAETQINQLIEENDSLLEQYQTQQFHPQKFSFSSETSSSPFHPSNNGKAERQTTDFCGGTCSFSELVNNSSDVKHLKKELKKIVHSHKSLEEHTATLDQILKDIFHILTMWSGLQHLPPQTPQTTLDLLKKVKYLFEIEKQQLQFDIDKLKDDVILKDQQFTIEFQQVHVNETKIQQQLHEVMEERRHVEMQLNELQHSVSEERKNHRTQIQHLEEKLRQKHNEFIRLEGAWEDTVKQHERQASELRATVVSLESQVNDQQNYISGLESSLREMTQAYNNAQNHLKTQMERVKARVDVGSDPIVFVRKCNKSVTTGSVIDLISSSFEYNVLLEQVRACEHKIEVTQRENANLVSLRAHEVDLLQEFVDIIRKFWSFEFETLTPLPNFLESCLGSLVVEKEELASDVNAFHKEVESSYNTIRELEQALHTQEDMLKEKEELLSGNETEINRLQRLADERDILLNELYERDPHHKIHVSPVSFILLKEEINRLENEKWNLCSELAFHKERTSFLESQLDQWKRSDSLMLKLTEFEQTLDDKVRMHKVDTNSLHRTTHSPSYVSTNNHVSHNKEYKFLEQQLSYLKKQLEEQIGFRFQLSEVSKELSQKEEELFHSQNRIQELEGLLSRKKGLVHDIGTLTEDRLPRIHIGIQCVVGNEELLLLNEKSSRLEKQVASLKHVESFLEEEKRLHKRTKTELERLTSTLHRLLRPPISAQVGNDIVSLVEFELQRLYQQSTQLEMHHTQKIASLEQDLNSLQRLMDDSIMERGTLTEALEKSRQEVDHLSRLYDQIREELEVKEKLVTQLQYIRKDLEEDLMLAKRQASTCSISTTRKNHQAVQVSMENAAVLKYELNCLREESQFSATHIREELQRAYLNIMELEKRIKWYQIHFPNCSPPPTTSSSVISTDLEQNGSQMVFGDAISATSYIEEADPQTPEEADTSSLVVTASAVVDCLFQEESVYPVQQQPCMSLYQHMSTSTTELTDLGKTPEVTETLKEEFENALKYISELQESLHHVKGERGLLQTSLDETRQQSQVSFNELQSENSLLKNEIETLEERLTQLTFSYEETQMALENFQHQSITEATPSFMTNCLIHSESLGGHELEESKRLCNDLQATKDRLEHNLNQMRLRICDLLMIPLDMNKDETILHLLEEVVAEMKRKVEVLTNESSSMKSIQEDLVHKVAVFQSSNEILDASLLSSQQEIENLKETNQILTESLDASRNEYLTLKQIVSVHVQSFMDSNINLSEPHLMHEALNNSAQTYRCMKVQYENLLVHVEEVTNEIKVCQNAISSWMKDMPSDSSLVFLITRLLNQLSDLTDKQRKDEELSLKESISSQKKISVLKHTFHLFHIVLESTENSEEISGQIASLICDWEEAFEKDISQEECASLFEAIRRLSEYSKLEEKACKAEWYEQEMKVLEESHMALQASMVDARQRTASLEEERNCLLQQIDGHIKQLQVKQLEIVSLREQQSRPAIAEPFGVSGIPFPLYSSRRPSHDESDHCSLSMTSCASLREDADSPFRASLGGNGSGETSSTVNEHHITVIRELQERISQSNNMLTTAIKTYALQSDIAALLPVLKDANHFLEEAEKERKALIQKYNKCLLSLRRYKIRVAALTRENTAFRNSSLVVDAMAATPTGEPIDSILQIKCDHEQELFSLRATCEQLTTELQSKQNEITRLQVYLIQPDKHDICQQTDILEHQKTVTMENESSLIEYISPSIEHRYQQTDNDIYEEQWKTHIGVLENRFEDANCLRMQAQHDFQLSQNAFEAKSRECEELAKNLEISTSEVKELNSRYKCLEEVHQTLMKQHSADISTLDMSIKHLEEERLGHIQEIDKITSDYSNLTNQLKEKQDFEKVEQQKLAEKVEKITTLESSNANLFEQLTTNLLSFDILNQEKEDLLSRLSDLEIEFQETKDQSRALGEEVKRLNEDKKQLQLQMGDLNANYMETCSRMMELEQQLQQVEGYFDVATQEVDRLRQLEAVHNETQEMASQLQHELATTKETVNSLERTNSQLKTQIKENTTTMNRLVEEKGKLMSILSEHAKNEQSTSHDSEILELQQQCSCLSEEIDRLNGDNAALQQQWDEINHQFQEECNRTIELERQLQQLEEYYDMATQEIDNLRNREVALIEELEIAKEAFERMEQEKASLQNMVKQYEQRAASMEESNPGETSASIASLNQQVHWLQVQLENTVNERSRIQQEFNRLSKAKNELDTQLMRLSADRELPPMSEQSQRSTPQQTPRPTSSVGGHSVRDHDKDPRGLSQEFIEEQISEIKNENAKLHVQVNILLTKCKKMEFKIKSLKKKNDNLVLKLEDKERELDESVDHIRKKLAIQERERTKWLREVANLKQQLQEKAEKIRCLEKHARGALNSDDLAHMYLSEVVQLREEVEQLTDERETMRLSKEEEWKAIQGTVEELKSDNRQLQSKLRAATTSAASQQQEASSSPLTSKSPSPAPDGGCTQCQQLAQMVQLLEDELQSRQDEKSGLNDWDDEWDFTSLANEQEA